LPQTKYWLKENNPVFQRFIGQAYIINATAFLHFEKDGKVQKLVHAFKYHNNRGLACQMGRLAANAIRENPVYRQVDVLIPVPLHRRRKRKRGYNQSEWLCRGIAAVWDLPICTTVLLRKRSNITQTRKAFTERWMNVQDIFEVSKPETLQGKHILLVDDVITSGSTLISCAKVLLTIPDIKVSILALSVA
jgi:ComF family protein